MKTKRRFRKWERLFQLLRVYSAMPRWNAEAEQVVREMVEVAETYLRSDVREETNMAKTFIRVIENRLHGSINARAAEALQDIIKREAAERRVQSLQAKREVLSKQEIKSAIVKALREVMGL